MLISILVPLFFGFIFFALFYRNYRFKTFIKKSNKILELKEESLNNNTYNTELSITSETKYLVIDYETKTIRKSILTIAGKTSKIIGSVKNQNTTLKNDKLTKKNMTQGLLTLTLKNQITGKTYKRSITNYTTNKYKEKRNGYQTHQGLIYKKITRIIWDIRNVIPKGNYQVTIKTHTYPEIFNQLIKERTFNLIIGTHNKEFNLLSLPPFREKIKQINSSPSNSKGPLTRK